MSDIYTTEYMEPGEYEKAMERTCSACQDTEQGKPLLDEARGEQQLGQGGYPRLVSRSGETNVHHYDKRSRRILSEMGFMFHVLIAMRAWKLVLLFFLSYLMSYLIIGSVLWATHDLSEFHGIETYWEAVVFIGYTMTTVGFGNQYPKHPESSVVPLMAVIFGLLMDSFWLGVIFARIASPRPLRHTILFSKEAVLYRAEDSKYTFSCRVVNLRVRYPWVDMSVKMTLSLFDEATESIHTHDLKICEAALPFFDLPWEIQHQVTRDSPLLRLVKHADTFDQERAEIIVELNGQDPLTGNCMKKRFSYCADEILRDYGFVGIVTDQAQGYEVDLTQFHDIQPRPVKGSGANNSYGAVKTATQTHHALAQATSKAKLALSNPSNNADPS